MLDSNEAILYGYEVKKLNERVKRNKKRFSEDFMFQLNKAEYELYLKSQIVTSSTHGGKRKLPYVLLNKMFICLRLY